MSTTPVGYEVRVAGHLDDRWTDWLDGWTLHRNPDGTTTVSAAAADQAQLHGLFATLRDLNVALLEVSAVPTGPSAATGH